MMITRSDTRGQITHSSLPAFAYRTLFHKGRMALRVDVMVLVGCVKSSVIGIVVNGVATHVYAILCYVVFRKQQTGYSGKSVVHLYTLAAFEGKDVDESGQLRPRVRL